MRPVIAQMQMMMAAISGGLWSPTNHSSDISLLDNGLSALCSGTVGGGIGLSDTSKTSGKYYVELLCVSGGSGAAKTTAFGLQLSPFSLSQYLGQSSVGYGSWSQGATGQTRNTYNGGVPTNASGTLVEPSGEIGRIAVDVGAGKLWLTWWGNTTWLGGGDPALGTSPTYTFTGGSTTYFACCPRVDGAKIQIVIPSLWHNLAPSGFGAW
jgi:hypothetical protein